MENGNGTNFIGNAEHMRAAYRWKQHLAYKRFIASFFHKMFSSCFRIVMFLKMIIGFCLFWKLNFIIRTMERRSERVNMTESNMLYSNALNIWRLNENFYKTRFWVSPRSFKPTNLFFLDKNIHKSLLFTALHWISGLKNG